MQLSENTVVIFNGPLGIGKSTLTEALSENIESCVALDGDALIAANPLPTNSIDYLHATITLLIEHHWLHGYRHFVINHIWHTPEDLSDIVQRIRSVIDGVRVYCFLLTLPLETNLQRIGRRRTARAIDDSDFELAVVKEERATLSKAGVGGLGEPLDVSEPPEQLVETVLARMACAY